MKKVIMLLLSICFILSGCGEKPQEKILEIPFQKVASCNNRTRLLEKYSYISERTASRPIGNEDFEYWILYYEKIGENINAILDYSVDYKCYYYNNQVFAEYGDGFLRTVVPYREKYESIISGLLARTDTLSYVFITNSQAEETDEGYKTSYEFIVNNDILPEFVDLGVNSGDRMCVEYDLDKDYIIQRCRYYRVKDEHRTQVARVDITYDEKKEFPEKINQISNEEKVSVRIIENFGTGAEYVETFEVSKGSYISENETLLKYYLFKDPIYENVFDTVVEPLNKDTDIFILDITYADMLAAREEYMQKQEAKVQQAAEEYMANAE